MSLVQAKSLIKNYVAGDVVVNAIRGVDFDIEPASFVCFVGPSGSGKSTLLNMIGCLDRPSEGTLSVLGNDVAGMNRTAAAEFRGKNIGFVFQDFNLLPVLTAYENVEYPLVMVQRWNPEERRHRVLSMLDSVGVADQAHKYPGQLSGGQKQRVAIARALVSKAQLVLADEPTANLDHGTAIRIIELMKGMCAELGTTFVFSTHDPKIMAEAGTTFTLEDGHLLRSDR